MFHFKFSGLQSYISDVIITSVDKTEKQLSIPTSRILLAGSCEYFRKLFTTQSPWIESGQKEILVKDIPNNLCLKSIIDSLYSENPLTLVFNEKDAEKRFDILTLYARFMFYIPYDQVFMKINPVQDSMLTVYIDFVRTHLKGEKIGAYIANLFENEEPVYASVILQRKIVEISYHYLFNKIAVFNYDTASISVFDLHFNKNYTFNLKNSGKISYAAFSRDKKRIAIIRGNKIVEVYSLLFGTLISSFEIKNFSDNDKMTFLYTKNDISSEKLLLIIDHMPCFYDINKGKIVSIMKEYTGIVQAYINKNNSMVFVQGDGCVFVITSDFKIKDAVYPNNHLPYYSINLIRYCQNKNVVVYITAQALFIVDIDKRKKKMLSLDNMSIHEHIVDFDISPDADMILILSDELYVINMYEIDESFSMSFGMIKAKLVKVQRYDTEDESEEKSETEGSGNSSGNDNWSDNENSSGNDSGSDSGNESDEEDTSSETSSESSLDSNVSDEDGGHGYKCVRFIDTRVFVVGNNDGEVMTCEVSLEKKIINKRKTRRVLKDAIDNIVTTTE